MSYFIYFFQMIKEQYRIIFYVIVIEIFNLFQIRVTHIPCLHKYQKKQGFPELSVEGQKLNN